MEIERLNYLTERAQGDDVYENEPEAINLAELVRRTESDKESSDWDVFAQIKIGDSISILKRFYYDDEGGKVSVIINNKGILSESKYSFKDAFKWHGEGYLEVEDKDSYKAYVSSIGLISKDEQGDLELKGNIGLMYEYKALFEVLHPQSRVIVPKISEFSLVNVSNSVVEIGLEPEQEVEVLAREAEMPDEVAAKSAEEVATESQNINSGAMQVIEPATLTEEQVKEDTHMASTEDVNKEPEADEPTADLEMLIDEAHSEANEYKRRLNILEQGGRLSEAEAYDADRHAAAEARLLSYQNAATILAAAALHEAREEEPVEEQVIQAPAEEQAGVSIESSEITELKKQLREANRKIVILEDEINYLSQDNTKLTNQVEDIDQREFDQEIEYAPPAVDKTEVEAQMDKSAEVETPSFESNQKEAEAEGERVIFNGAVKRKDGKFVSPKDYLTKIERGEEVGVESEKKESEVAVSLNMYDLDSGMRIGFPRALRSRENILTRVNEQINLFDPLKNDLGWLEDEIRKMVKSLRPSYTRDMLAQVKLIPPEPEEE